MERNTANSKHIWINKRTPKGVKPVREWIECKLCGARRPDNPQKCEK